MYISVHLFKVALYIEYIYILKQIPIYIHIYILYYSVSVYE